MIVLDSLPSREMVVDQCRTDSRDSCSRRFCRSDPAAADGNPSVHRSRSHSVSKRYHIVRIVIRGVEFPECAEINHSARGDRQPSPGPSMVLVARTTARSGQVMTKEAAAGCSGAAGG